MRTGIAVAAVKMPIGLCISGKRWCCRMWSPSGEKGYTAGAIAIPVPEGFVSVDDASRHVELSPCTLGENVSDHPGAVSRWDSG